MGIMPTETELALEQSQQGVSNKVSVNIKGLTMKKEVKDKGCKERIPPYNLRQKPAAYLQQQLQIAQEKEVGIQSTQEEFDFMATASACKETDRANSDKAPVYDSDGSAEVQLHDNCYNDGIFNMFTQEEQYTKLLEPIPEPHHVPQNDSNVIYEVSSVEQGGGTLEQHPATVKETRAYQEPLFHNLFAKVEKVNSLNRKMKETNDELTTELARYKNQNKLHDTIYENAKAMEPSIDKVSKQKDTTRGTSANTKLAKQSILGKQPSSSRPKLYVVTPLPKSTGFPKIGETNALSNQVTSNSVPSSQESNVVKNDNVLSPRIVRMNPFKASRNIRVILFSIHNDDGNLLEPPSNQALVGGLREFFRIKLVSTGYRDNNFTIEFDAFGFSMKDFLTRHILLRCDSSGDLYPITKPSIVPAAFLSTSSSTWHQRLGHPGDEVLHSLVSRQFISCYKEKSSHICHACQLGKHIKLPFYSSDSIVKHYFDIIHSDLWTSPIFHADGTLSRYKAPMVANGNSQQLGVDFDETFSPVVKPATIRTVLSLAMSRKWLIHRLDVKNAFLNGDLSETVYMHQPPGFVDVRFPNHVCQLQRSLYGLKQAPRAWFQRFAGYATRAGFYHNRSSSPTLLQHIIDSLHNEFDMTDLEALNYFLGISADGNSTGLFLSQRKFALQLLECAHMVHCNPSRTPIDTNSKLGPKGVPVQDPTLYCSLLEEEKARRRGRVFNWETATYGKIRVDDDLHDLRSVEVEFPAIVIDDAFAPQDALPCKSQVSTPVNDEIDFRISFDESDDEDYTIIYDKNSFSYKMIYVNNLKTDSENDNEKASKPSFLPPKPATSYVDVLDFFKDFEKEFSAIVYNDAQTFKSDYLTEQTLSPNITMNLI
ncbi:ribonuclease H-like domain-containing protein [Tanacetum coccineum]